MRSSLILLGLTCCAEAFSATLSPANMPVIGTVDKRFQSYNVEMLEVTGGRFWKPYKDTVAGAGTDLYEYRPPVVLSQARLRKLAAALGPFYLRVSGTWANTTWFQDADGPAPTTPPAGFRVF